MLKVKLPNMTDWHIIARAGRACGNHGWVLIALKNSFLRNYSILSYNADYCIGLSIYSVYRNHVFLLVYIPPDTYAYIIPINSLVECICYLNTELASLSSSYTLMGDFNLPEFCWTSISGRSVYSNLFLSTILELDLLPLVYEPTHRSGNTQDLIFPFHTEILTVFLENKLYSDHFLVFAFFTIPKLTLSTSGQNLSSQFPKA